MKPVFSRVKEWFKKARRTRREKSNRSSPPQTETVAPAQTSGEDGSHITSTTSGLHISQAIQPTRRTGQHTSFDRSATDDNLPSDIRASPSGRSVEFNDTNGFEVLRTAAEEPNATPEDIYQQARSRILDQDPLHVQTAHAILLWLVNTKRPMGLAEVQRAVAVCPDSFEFAPERMLPENLLVGICHGLVTIGDDTKLALLVPKEFLTGLLQEIYPHPHAVLAATCATHLADEGFQSTNIGSKENLVQTLKQKPFLAYAYDYWAHHAQLSLDVNPCTSVLSRFINGCRAPRSEERRVGKECRN